MDRPRPFQNSLAVLIKTWRPVAAVMGQENINLISWLLLRGLGFVYFAAFISFGLQARGLIGSGGILPLNEFLDLVRENLGARGYWQIPVLFWLDDSDLGIRAVCWIGTVFSALLTVNVLPRASLVILYACYLSLFYAGQIFTGFQWDLLLLEMGALGLVLSFTPRLGVWLYRWLAFRFIFMSGMVKIFSGEPAWRDFTALDYHFETQPLPTPLAWHAHHLPAEILAAATFLTLVIELALPFLIFGPRRARVLCAIGFLALQITILLTGNYNFFNAQSLLLCVALLDDRILQKIIPARLMCMPYIRPQKITLWLTGIFAGLTIIVSLIQFDIKLTASTPAPAAWLNESIAPLRLVNTYGPFSVMTKNRPEIIIEGSEDGVTWRPYAFRYKPGDIEKSLGWNIPHQPRVDWQLWFAAMEPVQRNPWFTRFMHRLLENRPEVTKLLAINPFPETPPRYVRATLYAYRFTTPEERKRSGALWARRPLGLYHPAISAE